MSLALTQTLTQKQTGKKQMSGVKLSFLMGLLVAFFIFLPFAIIDKGFFTYAGDYNLQQIPFFKYVQGYLQNFIMGNTGTWSLATDLGSSFVTSYSFYNLGSPFLWLSLIFPNAWMPYMMIPLFILKFGCIAWACSLYLSRYSSSRTMLVTVSLMYTFCGFNVYNIFFNHMLEPVIYLPLMLWAMDSLIYDNKRGWFALFVGLALLNSYFFFTGNVVFLLIYFVVKVVTGEYNLTIQRFLSLFLEAILGVGIGMALALPSFYTLMQNPRISEFATGTGMVLYGNVQQYAEIFTSLFFPPDAPWMPNLFTEGVIKHTSMSAFLPIVSMAGVVAYFKSRRKTSTRYILIICAVMACVPILNSAFYAFNASYYARWYYMPLLMMAYATMKSLEDEDIDIKAGAKVVLIITALYAIFGLIPNKTENGFKLGIEDNVPLFWLTFGVGLLGIGIFYLLLKSNKNRQKFMAFLLASVCGFSVFYSVLHLSIGKFAVWNSDSSYKDEVYVEAPQLDLPDGEFYRVDTYITGSVKEPSENFSSNLGLWINKSTLQTFNSTVSPSIMEFYPSVGVDRNVNSKPATSLYGLTGILSVKYRVLRNTSVNEFETDVYSKGWNRIQQLDTISLYENENFVAPGFTYDYYIDKGAFEDSSNAAMLLKGVVLDEDQIDKYGYLFNKGELDLNDTNITFTDYPSLAKDLSKTSASSFVVDTKGITCNIELPKDNLVFLNVPYDAGFTATVNGEPAEILNVSNGMMAVFAPQGENEIVLSYKTIGFKEGLYISLGAIIILVFYVFIHKKLLKRSKAKEQIDTSIVQVDNDADELGNIDFQDSNIKTSSMQTTHQIKSKTEQKEASSVEAYKPINNADIENKDIENKDIETEISIDLPLKNTQSERLEDTRITDLIDLIQKSTPTKKDDEEPPKSL